MAQAIGASPHISAGGGHRPMCPEKVAHVAQHLRRLAARKHQRAAVRLTPNLVQPKRELGDDPEVATAASRPHNRSRCSDSLAVTKAPDAMTTFAPSRLSHADPYKRSSQLLPLPSVKPPTPVVVIRPPVVASPCACVARSSSSQTPEHRAGQGHRRAGSARTDAGSTSTSPPSPRTRMELLQTYSLCRTQTPSAT